MDKLSDTNIPLDKKTIEQLKEERDYWQAKIDAATGWGAAVGAAVGFRDACDVWIKRREGEGK